VFVPGRLFRRSLMPRACPRIEGPDRQALLENNRLDWKDLPGKNTLAYYEYLKIADVKSFTRLSHGKMFLGDPPDSN
jgi:hypothetical protein